MATYLLLRNNKNSGPYSLEALIQLGLKPYDLVWVEGKSAAWRYPSEVEDLKFYAPVVEEQPYDRFYKKPSEAVAEAEKKRVAAQEVKPVAEELNYFIPEEVKQSTKINEIKTPRRQVFVSLPANTGNTFIKKQEPVIASAAQSLNELYNNSVKPVKKIEQAEAPLYSQLVNEYKNYQPRENAVGFDDEELPGAKNGSSVETKYSQSLDDIKDIYVQTLADRKRKTAQKKMIMMMLKRGLPFAAVLVVGFIMGGFLMNRKSDIAASVLPVQNNSIDKIVLKKADSLPAVRQTVLTPAQQQPDIQQPLQNETSATGAKQLSLSESPAGKKDQTPGKNAATQLPLNVVKKFVAKQNEEPGAAGSNSPVASSKSQSVETDPKTGERNKVVRADNENDQDNGSTVALPAKNSLLKQVNVKGNEYKVGTFGGIHDLELTVVNNSNYLLDHVMVELQYLKPSAQPLKTSNVQFDNVPPNGSLTLAIPATTRGIKVVYKVVNVRSKAAGNDTAGL